MCILHGPKIFKRRALLLIDHRVDGYHPAILK